ncbi:MAG: hypothetical protein R3D26_22190 [Cyanobacteriota/Melainabacteria group bacterium]
MIDIVRNRRLSELDNSAVEPREPYLDEMIKSIHQGPDETGRIIVGPAAPA